MKAKENPDLHEALSIAAAANHRSGLFEILKRAREAGVKIIDIARVIVANRGDMGNTIAAIEALIPKPPAE